MTVTESNELTVCFRGVRGSVPSPAPSTMRYGGNTSCLEIRYRGELLILDAGSGIRALGDELLAAADPIHATILLSHAHWDHIQGLPFFAPAYRPRNQVRVLAGPGRGAAMQDALASQMSPPHFPVPIEQMRALGMVEELPRGAAQVGSFRICTTQLNHPGGCTGFRVEAGPNSLAYLPDHEPYASDGPPSQSTVFAHGGLVEFVRGVDLLILDTQYTAQEYDQRIGWGHGALPESVALALEAGVKRLLLFHHDPSHDDAQIDAMVEAARELAAGSALTVGAASEQEPVVFCAPPVPLLSAVLFAGPAMPYPQDMHSKPGIGVQPAASKALGML